jgi:GTPase SAR1 family protein
MFILYAMHVFTGDIGVGKSSIIKRYTKDQFLTEYRYNIMLSVGIKLIPDRLSIESILYTVGIE